MWTGWDPGDAFHGIRWESIEFPLNQVEFRGIHRIPMGFMKSQFLRGIPPAEAVWGAFWRIWALSGRPPRLLGLFRTLVFHWFYKGFVRVEAL